MRRVDSSGVVNFERQKLDYKVFNTDTNLYVRNVKLITDLAKDPENIAVCIPEIVVPELDNLKKKPGDKKAAPRFSLASNFIETLINLSEDVPARDIGLNLPDLEARVKVVDFSNPQAKNKLNLFFQEHQLNKEDPLGKFALVRLEDLVNRDDYVTDKKQKSKGFFNDFLNAFLSYFRKNKPGRLDLPNSSKYSKNWPTRINVGDYDTLLIEASKSLSNHNPRTKLVAADTNLRSAANFNFKGLAEKPNLGLKESVFDSLPRGYHFIKWEDFCSDEFIQALMDGSGKKFKGIPIDKNNVNSELFETLRTQDYIILLDKGQSEKDFMTQIEQKDDRIMYKGLPMYMLPRPHQVVRFQQNSVDDFSLFPLDERLFMSDISTLFSGFEPRSFESLLFMDAMLRDLSLYIGYGTKGTGKTYTAIYTAISSVVKNRNKAKNTSAALPKLYVNRPSGEESIGYLPGELYNKMRPQLKSVINAYEKIARMAGYQNLPRTFDEAAGQTSKIKNKGDGKNPKKEPLIELSPYFNLKGDDFIDGEYWFGDEFQLNSERHSNEIISRLATGTYLVVGDPTQTDRENQDQRNNGITNIIKNTIKRIEYGPDERHKEQAQINLLNRICLLRFTNKIRSKHYEALEERYFSGVGKS